LTVYGIVQASRSSQAVTRRVAAVLSLVLLASNPTRFAAAPASNEASIAHHADRELWTLRNERPDPISLTVAIHVSDSAQIPREILETAEQKMSAIYQRAGINTVWMDDFSLTAEQKSEPVRIHDGALHLVVIIPPASAAERLRRHANSLGFAPRVAPRTAGRVVYAFYHRAQLLARSHKVDLATLFGHVLAHEIGHLLLPFGSHSLTGIMREQWDLPQLWAAEMGWLSFTDDQVKLIRATVSAAQNPSEGAPSIAPN
jgi:hypothetical protein